jgi:hypothetical protein
MLSPANPNDMFWDAHLQRMVPAAATMQLSRLPGSLRQVIQDNPSLLEDLVELGEEQGFPWLRQDPGGLLTRIGLDPSRFDLDGIRNRRIPPTGGDLDRLMLDFIMEVEAGPPPAPIDESQLTQRDWEVVRRLCDLGDFPQSRAIQAYFMANKQEQFAAEFLLEYSGMPFPGQ